MTRSPIAIVHNTVELSASNTDGSFTTAISSSFFGSLQKRPVTADKIVFGIVSGDCFYIDNDMLCVLIRIASMRRF